MRTTTTAHNGTLITAVIGDDGRRIGTTADPVLGLALRQIVDGLRRTQPKTCPCGLDYGHVPPHQWD